MDISRETNPFVVVRSVFLLLFMLSSVYMSEHEGPPLVYDEETGNYFPISNFSLQADPLFLLPPPDPREFPPDYLESLLRHCDDPNPGLIEFLRNTWTGLAEFGFNWNRYPFSPYIYYRILWAVQPGQLFSVFVMGVVLSLWRFILQKLLLRPLIDKAGLSLRNAQRFLESSWKAFWYIVLWAVAFHLLILSDRTDFQFPLRIFKDLKFQVGYFDIPTPPDYYRLYLLQLGFYLHSLWSVLFIDVWRKDSGILIGHHCMTLLLLQFSLVLRLHRVGALVVFLHDFNDVFLELAKVNVYLQKRRGKTYAFHTHLSNLLFTIFTVLWIVMRLYWFPLKVLYATSWGLYITNVGREYRCFLFFNVMLWALYAMHIYWFRFIVLMAFRLIICPTAGDMRESDGSDTEEVDSKPPSTVEQKCSGKRKGHMVNGIQQSAGDGASHGANGILYRTTGVSRKSAKHD